MGRPVGPVNDPDPPLPLGNDPSWRRVIGRCPMCGCEDLREGLRIRELWCFTCLKRITKAVIEGLERSTGSEG